MPLQYSKSKEALAANIAELHHANASKPEGKKRSQAQITAITYAVARKAKERK